ncbi:RNA-directed DNA polymerase, partial [Escherichia coli]|nr:RNA-directed DNA polymerase [Escherichia coli]
DYRGLNEVTKRDVYPLPLIDKTIQRVAKAKWFSKLDIRQAFYRLRNKEGQTEDLTTFATRIGNFKWLVMPFGLTNAPAVWQRFINHTFIDMLERFVSIYLDDILIYTDGTREQHTDYIKRVLKRLCEVG